MGSEHLDLSDQECFGAVLNDFSSSSRVCPSNSSVWHILPTNVTRQSVLHATLRAHYGNHPGSLFIGSCRSRPVSTGRALLRLFRLRIDSAPYRIREDSDPKEAADVCLLPLLSRYRPPGELCGGARLCMAGAALTTSRFRTKSEGAHCLGCRRLAHPRRYLFQRCRSQAQHPASHAFRL